MEFKDFSRTSPKIQGLFKTVRTLPLLETLANGGGRKGDTNTAIPHVVAREYRNNASKFSQIPKPQLQMGKS